MYRIICVFKYFHCCISNLNSHKKQKEVARIRYSLKVNDVVVYIIADTIVAKEEIKGVLIRENKLCNLLTD